MASDVEVASLIEFFLERHVIVQESWIRAVLHFFGKKGHPRNTLNAFVFHQWLNADIAQTSFPTFQPPTIKLYSQTIVMQIQSIIDISQPYMKQFKRFSGADETDLDVKTDQNELPYEHQVKIPSTRMLMMELTDGQTVIRALEHKLIPALCKARPGAKLLIYGRSLFRDDTILLTSEKCQLLGGKVEALCKQYHPVEIIKRMTHLNVAQLRAPHLRPGMVPNGPRLAQGIANNGTAAPRNSRQNNQQNSRQANKQNAKPKSPPKSKFGDWSPLADSTNIPDSEPRSTGCLTLSISGKRPRVSNAAPAAPTTSRAPVAVDVQLSREFNREAIEESLLTDNRASTSAQPNNSITSVSSVMRKRMTIVSNQSNGSVTSRRSSDFDRSDPFAEISGGPVQIIPSNTVAPTTSHQVDTAKRSRLSMPAIPVNVPLPNAESILSRTMPISEEPLPKTLPQLFADLNCVSLTDAQRRSRFSLGAKSFTVSAVMEKVVHPLTIDDDHWTMGIRLMDEGVGLDCEVNSDLLQRLIGLSAKEMSELQIQPAESRKFQDGRRRIDVFHEQLQRLDLLFTIEFFGGQLPVVRDASTMAERLNVC